MKKLIFIAVVFLQTITAFGQQNSGIKGVVIDSKSKKPMQNVVITLESTKQTELTKADGTFEMTNVAIGSHYFSISTVGYTAQYIEVELSANKVVNLGTISMEEDITSEQELSLITLTENDLEDDNSGSENTSGLLQASRDVFNQAAAYNFGQARFRIRGIDNEYSTVMVNGIQMNRLSDGRPQYANWGGLNDATRNQEFSDGTTPSDYTFGGTAGTQYINTRASNYRNGNRVSFLSTNTNYNFRVMGTTAVTNMPNGWSYVISAGRRWANEGHFEGTNYAANSFFASVEKRINDKHSIGITSIYAQNRRGKNSPNTQEVIDLKGFKYNSYWGYQEGEIRNSRFKDVEEPMVILSHYWKPSDKVRVNTNFGYQTGKIGNSRFDYQFSDNPDPVYYKKLPSYWTTYFDSNNQYAPNQAAADDLRATFLAYGQIDWKDIYRINNESLTNGSRIVLYEDRTDDTTKTGNVNVLAQLSDNIVMNGGVNYIHSSSENFKNLLDVLGGTNFNNINTFGIGDQRQNDLINPDRTIYEGDKYGYHYTMVSTKFDAFTQFKFTYKKVDFYMAQNYAKNTYQREGFYKNGYYPTNSYGKSDKYTFENFGFKGGLTYKFSGIVLLNANALYMSKAPNAKDVFPYQRQNNVSIENLTNETQSSVDVSFVIRAPQIKYRFTAYYNENKNTTDVAFYYADEINSGSGAFVTETVTGQNTRSKGIEFGTEMQFTSTLKGTLVAALGDYEYTNNPNIIAKTDSNVIVNDDTIAKLKGYKVSGTPQSALSVGLEYRDPKFWWIGANANYMANNYIDVAPLLRTNDFITKSDATVIAYDETLAQKYLTQEEFDSFYLINVVGGKSWRIKGKTLGLFANINNVLNTAYKTGGFEQSRNPSFSEMYKDHQGPTRSFGNKYFYGYGRTFMVNLYLNF